MPRNLKAPLFHFVAWLLAALLFSEIIQQQWAEHHTYHHFVGRWVLTSLVVWTTFLGIFLFVKRVSSIDAESLLPGLTWTFLCLSSVPVSIFLDPGSLRAISATGLAIVSGLPWVPGAPTAKFGWLTRPRYYALSVCLMAAVLWSVSPRVASVDLLFETGSAPQHIEFFPYRSNVVVMSDRHRRVILPGKPVRVETADFAAKTDGIAIRMFGSSSQYRLKQVGLNGAGLFGQSAMASAKGHAVAGTIVSPYRHTRIDIGERSTIVSSTTDQPAWIALRTTPRALATYPVRHHRLLGLPLELAFASMILAVVFFPRFFSSAAKRAMQALSQTKARWPRSAGLVTNTAVLFASIAIVLLAAEMGTRWWYQGVLAMSTGGDNYFYRHNYRKLFDEYNTSDYRGADFSKDPEPGVFRIVVMGDSIAYGQSVYPYTLRFPERVEAILNAGKDAKYEVINMGVSGRNTTHHVHYLDKTVRLSPDFVLYQWFVNDVELYIPSAIALPRHLVRSPPVHLWLASHSALYSVIDYAWFKLEGLASGSEGYVDSLVRRFADPQSTDSRRARREMNTLFTELRARGIPFGVVLFPHVTGPMADYRLGFLHERVLEACKENGIPCLDLREEFKSYGSDFMEYWANPFDAHPGAKAHQRAAEEIAEYFRFIFESGLARKKAGLSAGTETALRDRGLAPIAH